MEKQCHLCMRYGYSIFSTHYGETICKCHFSHLVLTRKAIAPQAEEHYKGVKLKENANFVQLHLIRQIP